MAEIVNPFEKGRGSQELVKLAFEIENALLRQVTIGEAIMILQAVIFNITVRVTTGGYSAKNTPTANS